MNSLNVICLIVLGVIAGVELAVRYGVQPAIRRLDDTPHILVRQALIRQLRILVPCIMIPGVILTILVAIFSGMEHGYEWRWAAVIAMAVYLLSSFLGTVPINIKVNDWQPLSPPQNWKAVIKRWERIDVVRSTAATLGFIFMAVSVFS